MKAAEIKGTEVFHLKGLVVEEVEEQGDRDQRVTDALRDLIEKQESLYVAMKYGYSSGGDDKYAKRVLEAQLHLARLNSRPLRRSVEIRLRFIKIPVLVQAFDLSRFLVHKLRRKDLDNI